MLLLFYLQSRNDARDFAENMINFSTSYSVGVIFGARQKGKLDSKGMASRNPAVSVVHDVDKSRCSSAGQSKLDPLLVCTLRLYLSRCGSPCLRRIELDILHLV